MPADSMIGEQPANVSSLPEQDRSRGMVSNEKDTLKLPYQDRDPSRSHERLTEKVIEKLRNDRREVSSGSGRRRHSEKSRSRSASKETLETEVRSSRRKSGKHREEDSTTGAESSLISNSALSANHKSGDQYSIRSGTSKSSINNPRLLETVEDAIRRLILPELKEMKRDQKAATNRDKFDRDLERSNASGSSASKEEVTRRVSKHGSAPEMKSRVLQKSNGKDSVDILSGGYRHRERRRKDADYDSQSDRSYSRRESGDSTSVGDDRSYRKKSKDHRVRDAAAGAMLGGALTAAALKHHDSRSDVEQRERRKKRSKSRSRSASVAESEEIFQKHEVPPMPMRSEVDSELTRSSLLSEQTTSTATPTHREMREVVRGSPREMQSPTSRTPTRTPVDIKRGLGTHHGNFSNRDLNAQSRDIESFNVPPHSDMAAAAAASAAAGAAGMLASERFISEDERVKAYENNLHHQHPIRRGLSPIQSVASYATTEPNRNSMMYARSGESLSSVNEERQVHREMSVDSMDSIDIAKSKRPQGISMESPSQILGQYSPAPAEHTRDLDADDFYDEQHLENDRYRDSYASSDPKMDVRHMTNYTDDSMDAPYLDKVTAGQTVARGWGANPEYVHTPPGVESAVASLYDPSLINGSQLSHQSYTNSLGKRDVESPRSMNREIDIREAGSPLKQQFVPEPLQTSSQTRITAISPPQSPAKSFEGRQDAGVEPLRSPLAEKRFSEQTQSAESPESEITTNPSVIQGPIGGTQRGNLDHWPYDATPPRSKGNLISPPSQREALEATEAALTGGAIGAGLTAMGDEKKHPLGYDVHNETTVNREGFANSPHIPSSPGYKDEGYATGGRSPGMHTPDLKNKRASAYAKASRDMDDTIADEDPFSTKHNRHLSGLSHGMGSPLYDNATGRGLDRIQSKDIVALMDHVSLSTLPTKTYD